MAGRIHAGSGRIALFPKFHLNPATGQTLLRLSTPASGLGNEADDMIAFWSRQALRFLSVPLAALCISLMAGAQVEEAADSPEAAPNYLGLELPLRPGERVVPTAGEDCSVVVFAPNEERYERFASYWRTAEWNGYCRFGLAHGKGSIAGVDGRWGVQA